jgi:hypothetical protein
LISWNRPESLFNFVEQASRLFDFVEQPSWLFDFVEQASRLLVKIFYITETGLESLFQEYPTKMVIVTHQ